MAERITMLFEVNTKGAHETFCYTGILIPAQWQEGELGKILRTDGWGPNENYAKVDHKSPGRGHATYFRILGPPRILGTAAARDLKFCIRHILQK